MKNTDDKLIIWCDDSKMLSPEEEAKYTWTEDDEKKIRMIVDETWKQLGLPNDAPTPEKPANASDVAKYILKEQGKMTTWKLQKLCYYAQVWHFIWTEKRLIKQDFQAWKNGPVCRELFKQHQGDLVISADDIQGNVDILSDEQKDSINIMLEHYGELTPGELVELTHSEEPYIKARGNLPANARSKNIITLESMKEYYGKHLI